MLRSIDYTYNGQYYFDNNPLPVNDWNYDVYSGQRSLEYSHTDIPRAFGSVNISMGVEIMCNFSLNNVVIQYNYNE